MASFFLPLAFVVVELSAAAAMSAPLHAHMDDPAILYSPYNWLVNASRAKTINPGAYFRTVFEGDWITLSTDTTMSSHGPYSQFWTRVDGGPLMQHVLSPGNPTYNISLGPPFSASRKHLLEVVVKSSSETISRWGPETTAVVFTGLVVGASNNDGVVPMLRAPARQPFNVLIYGDSITEGVRTMGYKEGMGVNMQNDTDRNDAVRDYSFQLSRLLPIEIGVVAFGATGTTKGGSGGVPALTESWNKLWKDRPRDFTTFPPDLVIYNEGTNDHPSTTATFTEVVANVRKACPGARQLLLLPFNGGHANDIKAVVEAMKKGGTPSNAVVYGDTTGFYSGEDGVHPFGYNHIAAIAPKVATLALPLLMGGPHVDPNNSSGLYSS